VFVSSYLSHSTSSYGKNKQVKMDESGYLLKKG